MVRYKRILGYLALAALIGASAAAGQTKSGPESSAGKKRIRYGIGIDYGQQVSLNEAQKSSTRIFLARPQLAIRLWKLERVPLFGQLEIIPQGALGFTAHPLSGVAGFELPFRLTFREIRRFAPFIEAGSGINYVGIGDRIPELSGKKQFSLLGRFGAVYSPKKRSNFSFEASLGARHYSNAGTMHPNQGTNYWMASAGVTWSPK